MFVFGFWTFSWSKTVTWRVYLNCDGHFPPFCSGVGYHQYLNRICHQYLVEPFFFFFFLGHSLYSQRCYFSCTKLVSKYEHCCVRGGMGITIRQCSCSSWYTHSSVYSLAFSYISWLTRFFRRLDVLPWSALYIALQIQHRVSLWLTLTRCRGDI